MVPEIVSQWNASISLVHLDDRRVRQHFDQLLLSEHLINNTEYCGGGGVVAVVVIIITSVFSLVIQ